MEYLFDSQMRQAGLDLLGRLLGGLGEDTALLQSVACIVRDHVLSEYGMTHLLLVDKCCADMRQHNAYKSVTGVDSHMGRKWFNLEDTANALQTATAAALEGEPIGPTGWTSHYSMERDTMDGVNIGTKEERKERAVGREVEQKCRFCQVEGAGLQMCGACMQVYYCTKEHQKLDWKRHKKDCVPMRAKKGF
mmetsp:Transcript_18586/g.41530  ORF Transcript_18586/g.41530 Transcript_18586/m.41530 type:complete len:192 (+) Transcript_18586:664-1239(+)